MKIRTHSPRAVQARKTIIELLLANHPDDCLYCVRNGNCELQELAEELGVRSRRFAGDRTRHTLDASSPSIVRDPAKCILCGKCVRICEEVQHVSAIDFIGRGSRAKIGTAFDEGLNVSSCVNCGQCVTVCPTGALTEKSQIQEVIDALNDKEKLVVVQHAPAVSVALGEEFGVPQGTDVAGAMTAALRWLGFDRVFDTSFAADLTIMEEGSELVHRLTTGGKLPMLTSCSPGWIKFVETYYPDFLGNLSTCKSPQQMMGAVIKGYFAQQTGIDPSRIYSVSIMPCTAKKFEAARPEMTRDGLPDIDAVLTTRELARLIRMRGLDLAQLAARHGRHAVRRADHGRQALRRQWRRDGSRHSHRPLPRHRPGTGEAGSARPFAAWKARRKPASTSTISTWALPWSTAWATPAACWTTSAPAAAATCTSSK